MQSGMALSNKVCTAGKNWTMCLIANLGSPRQEAFRVLMRQAGLGYREYHSSHAGSTPRWRLLCAIRSPVVLRAL